MQNETYDDYLPYTESDLPTSVYNLRSAYSSERQETRNKSAGMATSGNVS